MHRRTVFGLRARVADSGSSLLSGIKLKEKKRRKE